MRYTLAIDIGATSGRHILAHREDGELVLEEIFRFETPLIQEGEGHCHWDVEKLFSHILEGMKKAKEIGKIPECIGIDTFGVDYALLDKQGNRVAEITSYRDERTSLAKKTMSTPKQMFLETGIAPNAFNTAYQLYCDKQSGLLSKASEMILLPNYLAYRLTGKKSNELSILSTTALLDSRTEEYSPFVLGQLGLTPSFFSKKVIAGTPLGYLLPEIEKEVGYSSLVKASLHHDTGAAFFGAGAQKGEVLISSGTWSLLGTILDHAIVNERAYEAGFTNELSRPHEVRFLRNIMGMWLINLLKKEKGIESFSLITAMAEEGSAYQESFDAGDESLLNPSSMEEAILALLKKENRPLPKNDGELFYCVYHSLAKSYAKAIADMEEITGEKFQAVRIFGGGVKAKILNRLTELETGKTVIEGPSEATAIGNLLSIGA